MLRAFVDLERLDGICSRRRSRRSSASTSSSPRGGRASTCSSSAPASRRGSRSGTTIPREVGPDRIANAVAARERYGAPAIVVDFGTSTNFDVVSRDGEYVGGVLAPGIEISMDALFARAARLLKVPFDAPERVIGKTTTAALQSGLVYGFAGQVDGIVDARSARSSRRPTRRSSRPAASRS